MRTDVIEGGMGVSGGGQRQASGRPGQGPRTGYAPADSQGNFQPLTDEDTTDSSHYRFAAEEELDADPSERKPRGPIAEAVFAVGSQERLKKWLIPGLAFLVALFIQSIGLYVATRRYVWWMGRVNEDFGNQGAHSLPVAKRFEPQDNFGIWLGQRETSKVLIDVIAWAVPFVWLFTVISSGNLRLWTHTLLVGSILAVLKGLFAWMTLVPDSSGWEACKKNLNPQVLAHLEDVREPGFSFAGIFWSVFSVIRLWLQDLILGMRHQQDLVCPNSFSGSTYLCTIFALGLFDEGRSRVRKMKAHFRTFIHLASALLLSGLVLVDGLLDVVNRRQYTMDVTLAFVLALLFHSSPLISISCDYFMVRGSPLASESRDGLDVGDIVVTPCCVPFCCFHGRYFLYTRSAAQMEEALRAQLEATHAAEEFRMEQEETARRVLELEAQLEALRQRGQVRERQEAADAERRRAEQLAEVRKAHERRAAEKLADLEAKFQQERERKTEALRELEHKQELQQEQELEKKKLQAEVEGELANFQVAQQDLSESREQADRLRGDVEELRQTLAIEEDRHAALDAAKPPLSPTAGTGPTLQETLIHEAVVEVNVEKEPAKPIGDGDGGGGGDARVAPVESWEAPNDSFSPAMCEEVDVSNVPPPTEGMPLADTGGAELSKVVVPWFLRPSMTPAFIIRHRGPKA